MWQSGNVTMWQDTVLKNKANRVLKIWWIQNNIVSLPKNQKL